MTEDSLGKAVQRVCGAAELEEISSQFRTLVSVLDFEGEEGCSDAACELETLAGELRPYKNLPKTLVARIESFAAHLTDADDSYEEYRASKGEADCERDEVLTLLSDLKTSYEQGEEKE